MAQTLPSLYPSHSSWRISLEISIDSSGHHTSHLTPHKVKQTEGLVKWFPPDLHGMVQARLPLPRLACLGKKYFRSCVAKLKQKKMVMIWISIYNLTNGCREAEMCKVRVMVSPRALGGHTKHADIITGKLLVCYCQAQLQVKDSAQGTDLPSFDHHLHQPELELGLILSSRRKECGVKPTAASLLSSG